MQKDIAMTGLPRSQPIGTAVRQDAPHAELVEILAEAGRDGDGACEAEAGRESHCSYCGSEYWRCHTMEQAKRCNPSPKRQKRIHGLARTQTERDNG